MITKRTFKHLIDSILSILYIRVISELVDGTGEEGEEQGEEIRDIPKGRDARHSLGKRLFCIIPY
jgi:hypothetical protein